MPEPHGEQAHETEKKKNIWKIKLCAPDCNGTL